MRIYDYAKKMEIENKLILEALENNGVIGKKSSNSLSADEIKLLDGVFSGSVSKTESKATETVAIETRTAQQPGAPVRRVTIGLDTKHRYDSRKILEINARLSNAHERQAVATAQPPTMTREQREWQEKQKMEQQKSVTDTVSPTKPVEVVSEAPVVKPTIVVKNSGENTASRDQLPPQDHQLPSEARQPELVKPPEQPTRPLYNHNPRPYDPNGTIPSKPGCQPGRMDSRPYQSNPIVSNQRPPYQNNCLLYTSDAADE